MNIARLFSAYRILEHTLLRERVRHRVEVARLKRELLEWQNRVLQQAHVRPIPFPNETLKPTPPTKPAPPVGVTAKRTYLAEQEAKAS
jgi:hypothetical protein